MIATGKQRHTAIKLARLAAIVAVFLFVHDAMMAMSPHGADVTSHHEMTMELQACGSSEGVARSIPDSSFGPALVTLIPIEIGNAFDASSSTRTEPIHDGPDSSTIRIWQQVFQN